MQAFTNALQGMAAAIQQGNATLATSFVDQQREQHDATIKRSRFNTKMAQSGMKLDCEHTESYCNHWYANEPSSTYDTEGVAKDATAPHLQSKIAGAFKQKRETCADNFALQAVYEVIYNMKTNTTQLKLQKVSTTIGSEKRDFTSSSDAKDWLVGKAT